MTRKNPDRPLCADGTLAHHWLVFTPTYKFHGTMEAGKLIETTDQVCKKCARTRTNKVEVILDDDD